VSITHFKILNVHAHVLFQVINYGIYLQITIETCIKNKKN
jgi:hypothetical protein